MKSSVRILVLIGCALRLFHFLRDPSVWHDEAALIVNVLRLDFGQLLGPLLWNEAAPPLFLWLERAVSLIFGDSTYALRLVPVLASCISLVLIAATASRWLSPRGAFWAVLLTAISDRLLWHACEAKPYATDVCLASFLLFAFAFTEQWPTTKRIVPLMLLTPLMIFISYPACFLCGGAWLAMLPAAWKTGRWRDRIVHAAWAIVIGGAFAALYFGPIRAQRTGPMEGCWLGHFPDWTKPWRVPIWSVANTVETLRYAFKPYGSFLIGAAVLGGYWIRRQRSNAGLSLLVVPLGLAWAASCVGGYPYGGSRLEVFAAPALAILVGAGFDMFRDLLSRRSIWGIGYPLALLVVVGLTINTADCLVHPWLRANAAGASAYVNAHRRPNESIVANHWEYAYYFRDCADSFQFVSSATKTSGREWVVITAADERIRREMLANMLDRARLLDRADFDETIVALIEFKDVRMAQR